ncbi:MAG: hypothetical protein JO015_05925, partial [Verrucomicrobia bacterium]|nr:hypothetical protein [Verrucomicrobiota bacterium]
MRSLHAKLTLIIFIALTGLLCLGDANAANWYVRPSAAGSNTGADWNNAWSLSSINWGSIQAGDTVWLAGGSYSAPLTIQASG